MRWEYLLVVNQKQENIHLPVILILSSGFISVSTIWSKALMFLKMIFMKLRLSDFLQIILQGENFAILWFFPKILKNS